MKRIAIALSVLSLVVAAAQAAAPASQPASQPGYTSFYTGQIKALGAGTLELHVLRGPSGIIHSVNVDAKTEVVLLSGRPGKLSDLKVGQWIKVYWNPDPNDAKQQRIVKIEPSMPAWAAERLADLEKNAASLDVAIKVLIDGKGDEEELHLLGPDNKGGYKEPFFAQLTKDEMIRLLRYLAVEGFLAGAIDGKNADATPKPPAPPYVRLSVGDLYHDSPLKPEPFTRLEGFKAVLPDKAAAKLAGVLAKVREKTGVPASQPATQHGKPSSILNLIDEAGETLRIDATARTISGTDFALSNCVISKDGFAGAGWKDGKSFAVSGQIENSAYRVQVISGVGRARSERVAVMKEAANPMVSSSAPTSLPATQPSKLAAERADKLKADVKTFTLSLDYHGPQDKPYYNLLLSVPPMGEAESDHLRSRFFPLALITGDEAKTIIDHLAVEGFLDESTTGKLRLNVPCYTLTVRVESKSESIRYEDSLGWNLKMLQRLDGLRKLLKDDAAKSMDLLLGRMAGHRREWEQQATTQPASAPTDVSKLISDLSSDDGPKRGAASKAVFALGKDALDPLVKAGAKQISPFGTIDTRRIDMVYSLIDGLKPNPAGGRAGYSAGP